MKTISTTEAISQLLQGAVGVMPTDTVYGLVACANNPAAVARLYSLKQRDKKPGTVIAANIEQLIALGVKPRYLKAVEHLWPNPLSIVLPTGDELAYLHQSLHSLPFRVPAVQSFKDLLEQTGPLVSSSANQPGMPPANDIEEARHYFNDSVDFYVDGGLLKDHAPSTIIRIVDDAIEVLRPGAVKIDESGRVTAQ